MAVDNTAARLRLTLELLRERGEQRRLELWNEVSTRIPLSAEESEINTKGLLRGLTNWAFGSSDLVAAGWLSKDDGLWQITDDTDRALASFSDAEQMLREARQQSAAQRTARREQQQELLRSVIVSQGLVESRIREASALFVERGLRNGESVFVPGRPIWTKAVVDELSAAFLGAPPDAAGSNFIEKVSAQLAQSSDDARLLMAELVAWQLLPSVSLGEHAKLARVDGVLALMDDRVEIPHEIRSAFAGGVYRPGQRMSTQLHKALEVIIGVLDAWLALDPAAQEHCLESTSAWAQLVRSGTGESFPTQRNSLNYLVRPEYFGPIVASTDRAAIVAAFSGELSTRFDDQDEQLFRIFLAVQQKAGSAINFYDEPYYSRWHDDAQTELALAVTDDDEEPPADRSTFPPVDEALQTKTLFDGDWLQAALDVLEERRQVILYGPPGTGKTFVAQAIAKHVSSESDAVEIVQFHPSYAYEDFFEGLRPVVGDAGLAYEVRHGPLRQLAERAQQNPELNYVLIIDEINRGNIAKIFGELYFLLEYRDHSVRLPYSGDRFTIPPNVFVIGTMNTADRSIAALDAAMRRRFAFLELHPSRLPVEGVLRRWLQARELPTEAADLLDALNTRVPDDDLRIGPSYLMSTGIAAPGKLESVWRYDLLPLLAEHHYGDGTDVPQRYGLAELRRAIAPDDAQGVSNA